MPPQSVSLRDRSSYGPSMEPVEATPEVRRRCTSSGLAVGLATLAS